VTSGTADYESPLADVLARVADRVRLPVSYAPVVVPAIAAMFILGGLAFKAPCMLSQHGQQFSEGCYNDVQYLWGQRHLSGHAFPYVHGGESGGQFPAGTVEYPVLTGLFIWFSALFAHGANSFLVVSAVLMLPIGVFAAYRLALLVGWRALYFAAAPALVLYSDHNWDLLVVAAVVGAIDLWSRGHYGWAGVLLGVGAGLKFYPIFFIVPLVLDRLIARDRVGVRRALGGSIATIVVVNLPFILINARGWWGPYAFQKQRAADYTSDSIWVWGLSHITLSQLNVVVPVVVGVACVVAVLVGCWIADRTGAFPFVQVCAAMLIAFVLFNKAFSPQYALWLIPFFALIRVRWGWWVAFVLVDLLLYFGLFRWYFDVGYRHYDFTSLAIANQAIIVAIWARAVLVGLLFVVFLFARSAITPREAEPVPAA
jgi:uncharacterized membrane protein